MTDSILQSASRPRSLFWPAVGIVILTLVIAGIVWFGMRSALLETWTSVRADFSRAHAKDIIKNAYKRNELVYFPVSDLNPAAFILTKEAASSTYHQSEATAVFFKDARVVNEQEAFSLGFIMVPITTPETATASSTTIFVPEKLGNVLSLISNQEQQAEQKNLQDLAGYLSNEIQKACVLQKN